MKRLMTLAGALLLTGCTHLNGLIDAGDAFGCGVAPGVRCAALSENFERQERSFAREAEVAAAETETAAVETGKSEAKSPAKQTARKTVAKAVALDDRYPKLKKTFHEPRRAAEVVMALWVMPWVDADGDFHGASRIWLKVEEARWQLERERSRATAETPAPEDF